MNKVHLIGNAHLDPAWLWRWQEGYTEVLCTFRSALERMKEHEDYVFTCAGAAYYSWVEKTDPAMFEEIRQRVAEGRWVIVGGWWVQPDCNLPSGESFARHALYSQRYFQSRFGVTAKVGYNVDSFGHNAMIPQLLKQSGMDAYVYMRPSAFFPGHEEENLESEKTYPFPENVFLWEGADGTRVPAYRIRYGYGSGPGDAALRKAKKMAEHADEQDLPLMSFYGVGNHGGGPTAENLTLLDGLLSEDTEGRYLFSSPNQYFAELPLEKLKVLKDDLQNHASGCYTAMMEVKELNRQAEEALVSAEKFHAMAKMPGLEMEELNTEKMWRTLMFHQFHDLFCGCSIKKAHDDTIHALGGVIDRAYEVENEALQKIFWNVETLHEEIPPQGKFNFRVWDSSRGVPVIVFNPHSWDVEAPLRMPVFMAKAVTDHEGKLIPMQNVDSQVCAPREKEEPLIYAKIPAMGYRVFRVYREDKGEALPERSLKVTETVLENDWTRLELDGTTGAIVSLFDKTTGKELVSAPCLSRVMDETECDTWSHLVYRFDKEVGAFELKSMRIAEDGNIRGALVVNTAFGSSTMEQKFIVYRDKPGVFVEYRVFWAEQHKLLKLCYPVNINKGVPTSSIPYGFMDRRPDGREYPMHSWMALREDGYGLGIASDSRCAYDATENEVRITALRSPIFADHYGFKARDVDSRFTEQGEHFFTMYLGAVGEDTLSLQRTGELLVSAPRIMVSGDHHGTLPEVNSVLSCDRDGVDVSVVKMAEDGSGTWILRCHECRGEAVTAKITFAGTTFEAAFKPQQIRTFRICNGEVSETNFTEMV